jgi:hypothetical protein
MHTKPGLEVGVVELRTREAASRAQLAEMRWANGVEIGPFLLSIGISTPNVQVEDSPVSALSMSAWMQAARQPSGVSSVFSTTVVNWKCEGRMYVKDGPVQPDSRPRRTASASTRVTVPGMHEFSV